MPKLYIIYCLIVLGAFGYGQLNGYVLGSLITGQGVANRAANHYHK